MTPDQLEPADLPDLAPNDVLAIPLPVTAWQAICDGLGELPAKRSMHILMAIQAGELKARESKQQQQREKAQAEKQMADMEAKRAREPKEEPSDRPTVHAPPLQ